MQVVYDDFKMLSPAQMQSFCKEYYRALDESQQAARQEIFCSLCYAINLLGQICAMPFFGQLKIDAFLAKRKLEKQVDLLGFECVDCKIHIPRFSRPKIALKTAISAMQSVCLLAHEKQQYLQTATECLQCAQQLLTYL